MRIFLITATTVFFLFGTIAGSSVHTLIEAHIKEDRESLMAAKLVALSIRQLSQVNI